ncbi:hypothetical protein EDC22_105224 [Tepidamorphus gemmatus]|uniref:Uncharacterized protein n=1 Tax=Tepidamorphus gemmatus TaxID=747076 RepID=A0A4R3MAU1_9HYPH|nr:type II secretion system protein [Tepidamorphus gemmatus]TCT10724.1 hypothetical protein EDC22_105224 [Tepidamorphus gemmatus]
MPLVRARSLKRQGGFTLVEMVLAVGLTILMIASLSSLLLDAQREAKAGREAETLLAFQRAAAEYFLANRTSMMVAMESGEDPDRLCRTHLGNPLDGRPGADAVRHTCRVDASLLKARRLLPSGTAETNSYGERLIAIFRRIYDDDGDPTDNVEMVVLAALEPDRSYVRSDARLRVSQSVAAALGASGGTVADADRGLCRSVAADRVYEVCGSSWKVDLTLYLSESELSAFAQLLPR